MASQAPRLAIVGATGLVGSTLLAILETRPFPMMSMHVVASAQSVGKSITFRGQSLAVHDLDTFDFTDIDIAFFCVSNDLAKQHIPRATQSGTVVIDKSHFFRNHPDVPLIVPEVNPEALAQYKKMRIIANPNCSVIPLAVALKPLYDAAGITRINIATYQSVSGTGKEAVLELTEQSKQVLHHETITPHVYPQQIAFNVLPHIDTFLDNAYTKEEMKMVWELRKIFSDEALAVNPTAVRVPVYYGHAAAVHVETRDKMALSDLIARMKQVRGLRLIEGEHPYPTPVKDAAGRDEVYVGRIREDISHPSGINLWVVSDNLRKGAALNAIQIAELLVKDYLHHD